jgi:predicted GIY-YIG superfamily endonuclease
MNGGRWQAAEQNQRGSSEKKPKGPHYTLTRRSLQLVWSQDCPTQEEALSAERQIKGEPEKERSYDAW